MVRSDRRLVSRQPPAPMHRVSVAVCTMALLVLAGCDTSGPEGAAPTPMPPAAFDLGAGAFPRDGAGATGASQQAGLHYVNAAARVGILSTVIGLRLAIPVAATEALTREAPVVTNGVWVWTATADGFGTPVDVRLDGTPSGDQVSWTLVSTPRGGAPFTIYTASTSLDGATGTWRLFDPSVSGPILTAEFDVRAEDRREVTFRVPAGLENGGSSVRYETAGPAQTFDWLDQPENDRALIRWDVGTRAGSIEADAYNGGRRACWDGQLRDVACG